MVLIACVPYTVSRCRVVVQGKDLWGILKVVFDFEILMDKSGLSDLDNTSKYWCTLHMTPEGETEQILVCAMSELAHLYNGACLTVRVHFQASAVTHLLPQVFENAHAIADREMYDDGVFHDINVASATWRVTVGLKSGWFSGTRQRFVTRPLPPFLCAAIS